MLDFRARGFGFIPARKTESELSLQEQLVERLEERFRKHQASTCVPKVALSAIVIRMVRIGLNTMYPPLN